MQANQLVKINGNAIDQIVYKDQPVITLRMMDELHERKEGTAKRNFHQNNDKLIEGKHFFSVPYDEWSKISEVRNSYCSKNHNQMTFLTLKGYLLLVKSFTDDLAWKIQDEMVDVYFQTRQATPQNPIDEKLDKLEKLKKIKSAVSKQEYEAIKADVLRNLGYSFMSVKSGVNPLNQLLDLVINAYKAGRFFDGVDVTEDQTSIIFKTHALNKAFNTLSREHGIKNPFKNVFSLHANIRHSNQSLQWDYLNLNTRDNKGNRLYKLVKCLH